MIPDDAKSADDAKSPDEPHTTVPEDARVAPAPDTSATRYLRARSVVAGRYRLLEELGRGGMGRVWRAHDGDLVREVAVKEVDLRDHQDPGQRHFAYARARREAQAAARIDHPNVVRIYDVVDHAERLWIVMELVTGRTLSQVVREKGPLGVDETVRIGLSLASALGAVHEAGVVHRDVKPANVQLEPKGRVVLMDFGIAAIVDLDTALTQTGVLVGTVGYMAPERLRNEPQHPASDLWSLGATLFHAITGRAPFARTELIATLAAVLHEEADVPASAGPIGPLLAALLDRDPDRRPTAGETVRELTAYLQSEDPTRALPPRRRGPSPSGPVGRRTGVPDRETRALLGPPEPGRPQPVQPSTGLELNLAAGGEQPHWVPVDDGPRRESVPAPPEAPRDPAGGPAVPEDRAPTPEDRVPLPQDRIPGPAEAAAEPRREPPRARSYIPRKPATAFAPQPTHRDGDPGG
ncbi:protein kinase [Streptomyces sp. NPDC004111]|uniref:serine/threonine-protein kinase n=1 Tax=Streptomyces sp. NPDC004111 TaxID=3364690 RepID=UPI0036A2A5DC